MTMERPTRLALWAPLVAALALALSCATGASCKKGDGGGAPPPATPSDPPAAAASRPPAAPAPVADAAAAEAAIGRVVEVTGTARNAKLSAVVIAADLVLHLLDRPEWSDERDGTTVTVRGRLERTDEFAARTDPSGARSAGTAGGDWVLRTSELVPPPE